ncbi:MAG: CoA pyrophosphatase [Deltaproteobacteria bacterium]|nr:CoA pyrophosphatase [Deltaproteobacteria bacterium]
MVSSVPTLDLVRRNLASHEPVLLPVEGKRQAAVAMVLREGEASPELLFIERAHHAGDPWSGHMAFPGGRVESADGSARQAAERETLEEVGVSLGVADYLGRVDDVQGHAAAAARDMVISAHVYQLLEPSELVPNYEVQEAFWFPLAGLLDDARHVVHAIDLPGRGARFPGILVGVPERHVVWGLTYRFLELFFEIVGRPLPPRWHDFG